jgi:hypothetical protein
MSMLDKRLQVLIDEGRWHRLIAESRRRRVSVAVLVREALDLVYPVDHDTRRAAGEEILAAEPMELPPLDDLLAELDDIRSGAR